MRLHCKHDEGNNTSSTGVIRVEARNDGDTVGKPINWHSRDLKSVAQNISSSVGDAIKVHGIAEQKSSLQKANVAGTFDLNKG